MCALSSKQPGDCVARKRSNRMHMVRARSTGSPGSRTPLCLHSHTPLATSSLNAQLARLCFREHYPPRHGANSTCTVNNDDAQQGRHGCKPRVASSIETNMCSATPVPATIGRAHPSSADNQAFRSLHCSRPRCLASTVCHSPHTSVRACCCSACHLCPFDLTCLTKSAVFAALAMTGLAWH